MKLETKQWITGLLIAGAAIAGWRGSAARSEHAMLDAQLANLAQVREELARQAHSASADGAAAIAASDTAKGTAQQQRAAPPASVTPAAPPSTRSAAQRGQAGSAGTGGPEVESDSDADPGLAAPPEPKSRAVCFVVTGESVPRPAIRGLLAAREPPRLLLSWPDGSSDWLAEGESAHGWELMHLNLREAELIHERAREAMRWRAQ